MSTVVCYSGPMSSSSIRHSCIGIIVMSCPPISSPMVISISGVLHGHGIEENNKMGRTGDLYREIKESTGSYSSRCGAMKLSTGEVVTEGKEVKEIWQQYTEEQYRRDPNATDSFNENIYEDEPEVMEIEVKEAFRHISNRKSAGCDGIPLERLNAGGEEAVQVMTGLCNSIWKRKEWPTKACDRDVSSHHCFSICRTHNERVFGRMGEGN